MTVTTACPGRWSGSLLYMSGLPPSTPPEAFALLMEGNERFVHGDRLHPNQDADRRSALAPGQRPFAVLFGCSDSRLAAEIIFDRGLGDLFVVRTAGHVSGLVGRSPLLATEVEAGRCAIAGLSYRLSEGTVGLVAHRGPLSK